MKSEYSSILIFSIIGILIFISLTLFDTLVLRVPEIREYEFSTINLQYTPDEILDILKIEK